MREIKFRVFDVNTDSMLSDSIIVAFGYDDFDWVALDDEYESICTNYSGELTQFTGLTDKNGVDIYEGDLYEAELLCTQSGNRWGGSYWVKCLFEVRFIECGFKGVAIKQLTYLDMKFKINGKLNYLKNKIEVIGNIHQNQELLK